MTPRSRGHGSGRDEEPTSGSRRHRGRGGRPGSVEQGEQHVLETLRNARPTAAADGPAARSSPSQPKGVPYGFRDFGHFREFATRFRDRMREHYPDLDMGFQGSAVTGRSADLREPFDEGRISDYDIAISGESINAAAHANGVRFRGDGVSTGPLSERDLDRLGLDGIVDDASAESGREVNIMIFRTIEEAAARKPTIKVWF